MGAPVKRQTFAPRPVAVYGVLYPSVGSAIKSIGGMATARLVRKRLSAGWAPEDAVSAPPRQYDAAAAKRTRVRNDRRWEAEAERVLLWRRWRRVEKVLDRWRRERDA